MMLVMCAMIANNLSLFSLAVIIVGFVDKYFVTSRNYNGARTLRIYRCSENTIDDYQGYEGPIRVCNYCYKLLHTTPQDVESAESGRLVSLSLTSHNAPNLHS